MSQMTQPVPQRNTIMWILGGMLLFGIPLIIYYYNNFADMKKLAMAIQAKTGKTVNTLSPGLAILLTFIPILNFYVIMKKQDDLIALLDVSGMPIQDRPMSGIMIILMLLLSWLMIPMIIVIIQVFKWQSIMNQAAQIANS